jgi:hypothetical protein
MERRDRDFTANALPGLAEQTGIIPRDAYLGIVHTTANGGWDFVVARPWTPTEPNPHTWWIYDADVDESECWVSQATFTPDGRIDHHDDPRFAVFDHTYPETPEDQPDECGCACHRNGFEVGCMDCTCSVDDLPEAFHELRSRMPPSEPRNMNGPVTMSIDLDEAERAKAEGIPDWEEHGQWSVLANDKGFAVIFDDPAGATVGLIRYGDNTATPMRESNLQVARETAEKWLASRPYKTAAERILEGASFDAEEPAPEVEDTPTSPAVPRPTPPKREWKTVPINSVDSVDEDD